jgi:DNA-directed RNA polymerase subunit RPC12/RpoP
MMISYFCNTCENEDDFVLQAGTVHCTSCGSNDIEIIKEDGPPYGDEINEDRFFDPYEDLEDLFS